MIKAITVSICLFFGIACGAPSPRVIGGDAVVGHRYPYQVSIQSGLFGNVHQCGGAIISPKWVVTAAHCAGISLIVSRVVAGTFDLSDVDNNTAVQIRTIDLYNVVKHPKYNEMSNDIALLKMNEPFEFNEYVKPLPISKVKCVATDETTTFSGWGTNDDSDVAPVLQTANMTVMPYDECHGLIQAKYGDNLPLDQNGHICVTGVASPCLLDAGGPLVQDSRLVGLLAWLPETCSDTEIPAIFTNTGYYKDFIKQNVDDLP